MSFHDSARAGGGKDVWEHESARNAFYYLKALGYGNVYAAYVARMIVKEENSTVEKESLNVSRKQSRKKEPRNTFVWIEDDGKREPDLNEQIVHDADTLEILRIVSIRNKFDKSRFKFLLGETQEKVGLSEKAAGECREALIADALQLILLTTDLEVKGPPYGPGLIKLQELLEECNDYQTYFAAYESVIIEAIFADPTAFPFFYRFYFFSCFNPEDEQLQKLHPTERLALIRTWTHTCERFARDRFLADHAIKAYNSENDASIDLDTFAKDLVTKQLTVNLKPMSIAGIIDTNCAHYQVYWELFFNSGLNRPGGGASSNAESRDRAERFKVQYQMSHKSKHFDREQYARRPKYAAVNLANVFNGACGKYGDACFILEPHVWRRATLTHNDTFNNDVLPDDLCAPGLPFTLLMQISAERFSPQLLTLYAAGKGSQKEAAGKLRAAAQAAQTMPYMEVHVHGPVTWEDDVAEIRIEVTGTKADITYTPLGEKDEVTLTTEGFDKKVQVFAAQFSKRRSKGVPVRFTHKLRYGVFATREDALDENAKPLDEEPMKEELLILDEDDEIISKKSVKMSSEKKLETKEVKIAPEKKEVKKEVKDEACVRCNEAQGVPNFFCTVKECGTRFHVCRPCMPAYFEERNGVGDGENKCPVHLKS